MIVNGGQKLDIYLVNPACLTERQRRRVILSKKVILSMNFLADTSCPITTFLCKTNPILSAAGGLQVQL
jgi:hypothetical protein